jgi:hypothetical protein
VFNNFNSTSTDRHAAEGFLGPAAVSNLQVFLAIECILGFSVSTFSEFPKESEIVMPPGAVFQLVEKTVSQGRLDLHVRQLPPSTAVMRALGIVSVSSSHRNRNTGGSAVDEDDAVFYNTSWSENDYEKARGTEGFTCSVRVTVDGSCPPPVEDAFEVPHGAKYKVVITNAFATRCLVTLRIDGYAIGRWVLKAHEIFTAERPIGIARCFTFFRESLASAAKNSQTDFAPAGTGIEEGRSENGTITCEFVAEASPAPANERQ